MRADRRRRLNRLNGTTLAGRALARAVGCRLRPGPAGTTIAEHYPLRVPAATCFVVGDVVFCRESAAWLLADPRRRLLAHELRHTSQYAVFGPVFWPLYFASAGISMALTGSAGSLNPFERAADLADGGYRRRPLRWHRAR